MHYCEPWVNGYTRAGFKRLIQNFLSLIFLNHNQPLHKIICSSHTVERNLSLQTWDNVGTWDVLTRIAQTVNIATCVSNVVIALTKSALTCLYRCVPIYFICWQELQSTCGLEWRCRMSSLSWRDDIFLHLLVSNLEKIDANGKDVRIPSMATWSTDNGAYPITVNHVRSILI